MPDDRVTTDDVRATYTEQKRRTDRQSHLWAYLVVRPLSFYITPFFVNRGVSANTVTGLGLAVLLAGLAAVLLAARGPEFLLAGAGLVNVWYLLDFVDGNVARVSGASSRAGAFYDWYVGTVYHVGLPVCAALGVAGAGRFTVLSLDPGTLLAVAVAWVVAMLWRKLVAQKSATLGGSGGGSSGDVSRVEVLAGAYTSFTAPLFLVAAAAGAVDVWLLLYGLYHVVSAPVQLVLRTRRLRA